MMAAARAWLTAVVSVTLLLSVIQMLTPKGSLREITSFVGGLLLLTVLLRPLGSVDLSAVSLNLDAYRQTVEQRQAELEQEGQKELVGLIEAELESYISDKAADMGLTLRVQVTVEPDGSVSNFVMNDKCAAGTGRFLEMMARTLEISLEDISTIGLKWKEEITISSMCTVFADSEVVSLVAQNKALPDIVHGLNQSVATRAAALFRRIGGAHPCMMTGGVSRNQGVVGAIEEKIGQPLYIHPDAQLCGALGAALFALEMP